MRRCKRCRKSIEHMKASAIFCDADCRRKYWAHNVEPREVCVDCGTQLGIGSVRNTKFRDKTPRCPSCARLLDYGVGTF